MNRRAFLAALAAPLIAAPTLEQIERTWRRRFFPGWSPGVLPHMGLGELIALELGDVVTIAGCHAKNPRTGRETALLQLFVVTESGRRSLRLYPPPPPDVRAGDVRPLLTGKLVAIASQ